MNPKSSCMDCSRFGRRHRKNAKLYAYSDIIFSRSVYTLFLNPQIIENRPSFGIGKCFPRSKWRVRRTHASGPTSMVSDSASPVLAGPVLHPSQTQSSPWTSRYQLIGNYGSCTPLLWIGVAASQTRSGHCSSSVTPRGLET